MIYTLKARQEKENNPDKKVQKPIKTMGLNFRKTDDNIANKELKTIFMAGIPGGHTTATSESGGISEEERLYLQSNFEYRRVCVELILKRYCNEMTKAPT